MLCVSENLGISIVAVFAEPLNRRKNQQFICLHLDIGQPATEMITIAKYQRQQLPSQPSKTQPRIWQSKKFMGRILI